MKKIFLFIFLISNAICFSQQVYTPPAWKLHGNNIVTGMPFLGTTNARSLNFVTNNLTRFQIDSTGIFLTGALTYTDINIWSSFQGNNNNYYQSIWQNTNGGSTASTDLVISNDIGTKTSNYANFGINSSGFTGNNIFNKPNTVYLTSQSSPLAIGTLTNNSTYILSNPAGGVTGYVKYDSLGSFIWKGRDSSFQNNFIISNLINPAFVGFAVPALYFGVATPTTTNYLAWTDGSIMRLNGQSFLNLGASGHDWLSATTTKTTTGTQITLTSNNQAIMAAGANCNHILIQGNKFGIQDGTTASTVKFSIAADTYSNSGAGGIITTPLTFDIPKPIAGTGVTFTSPLSLRVTGATNMNGQLSVGASIPLPLANLHIGAGNATLTAMKFTTQTAVSSPANGELFFNTATLNFQGNLTVSGSILSSSVSAGIGYAVGSGSTVTQATSRTTGVTINSITGAITLVSAAGLVTYQTFVVTNSAVTNKDVIIVNQKSGTDKNIILVTAVGAGSFSITFATTGGVTTEQPVFNFAVIKGQTN